MGYDDKKPEIAEIERYFDNKGKYEYFKQEYERRFGETWENGRKSILLKQQRLAELMADIDGIDQQTAANNIKTQIANYKIDTDGFVSLVKAHLDKQQPGSRFIFFVDEVGQFIGKDVHRMLSLQTIAEGLSDKTDGRSIIIVTSQMDIDATLGNLDKQQQYDFSRIQGRFETRISLTSANADEVIQRRLLEKKPEPQQMLCEVYQRRAISSSRSSALATTASSKASIRTTSSLPSTFLSSTTSSTWCKAVSSSCQRTMPSVENSKVWVSEAS